MQWYFLRDKPPKEYTVTWYAALSAYASATRCPVLTNSLWSCRKEKELKLPRPANAGPEVVLVGRDLGRDLGSTGRDRHEVTVLQSRDVNR
eukprot:2801821-Rhodomonas_salina.1